MNDEATDSKTRTAAAKALLAAERVFQRREMALVHVSNFATGLSAGAGRHLREGFARRLFLMQANRMTILEVASPARTDDLSFDEVVELNVHFNSYYFQMRGALDNLAWSLHYELELFGQVDEDEISIRSKCQLFHGRLLDTLGKKKPKLAEFLRGRMAWALEFKELRDPIAHRIPLYAVPGVAFPPDVEKMADLNAAAKREAESGNLEASFERLHEARAVPGYQPVFATSGTQGLKVNFVHEVLQRDQKAFLETSEAVVEEMELTVP